jgi:hypothetical protein
VPELVFAIVLVREAADAEVDEVATWIGWDPGLSGAARQRARVRFRPMSFMRRVLSAVGKGALLEIGCVRGPGLLDHLDPKDPCWFSTDCIEPPPVES